MGYVFYFLLTIQVIILATFVFQSIKQRKLCHNRNVASVDSLGEFDVIIAAREDVAIIQKCISNVLSVGFNNIILCIDGGSFDVYKHLKEEFPSINILFNKHSLGKINAQIKCLRLSSKNNVLILDADISLIKKEIPDFVSYYNETKVDFLCPYSIGVSSNMNSWLFAIAETDRHMRQRVVRAGRDAYGVSNLSGYCMLAKREKYINIIDTEAVQDDVIATINLLQKKYVVKTYHKAVCSEIERSSFKSYLMQKTRWTAGNLALVGSYRKLFKATTFVKALTFSSSFLLWYWALWIDFIAFFVAWLHPAIFALLTAEGIIKYTGLYFACKPESRNTSILLYIVFWPAFSTLCLILSPWYLSGRIVEQKTRR